MGAVLLVLIGAVSGFILCFMIDYIIYKVVHKRKREVKGTKSETGLVVDCPDELVEKVEEILWEHLVIGVAKVEGEF